MALNIAASFPGKSVAPSAAYPFGSAQNVTAPGTGDGTPLVADIYNDLFGFQQGLLAAAGLTASGDPDTALVSQYLDAINIILQDSHDRLNPASIGVAVADARLEEEDVLTTADLNITWVAVLASSVTTNLFNKIQCTGVPTLAIVRRYDSAKILTEAGNVPGIPEHRNINDTLMTFIKTSQSGAPSVAPLGVGQTYVDILTGTAYIAIGTTDSTDWKVI